MNDQYKQNKHMFTELQNINQTGGGKQYVMIDKKQRDEIKENYNNIITSKKPCKSFPLDNIQKAVSGINLSAHIETDKNYLCSQIKEKNLDKNYPMIHEDSLTAWANQATENYALTIGDIMKMKFGETMNVLFIDRNAGENIPVKKGEKFDPTKYGLTTATYIHGENLTGLLKFEEDGIIYAPFQWEINRAALDENDFFWGPIDLDESCCAPKTKKSAKKRKPININDLNKNILVGWRGPGINMINVKKYMPKYVTYYDTWWDDYVVFRYKDYLNKKLFC